MRRSPALVLLLALTSPVAAQEPYEFGIRFRPQNFGPAGFQGFSFSGQTYRNQFGPSIQFSQIDFPSFRSSIVRQRLSVLDYVGGRQGARLRYDGAPVATESRLAQQRNPYRLASIPGDRVTSRRGHTVIAATPRSRSTGVGRTVGVRTASSAGLGRIAFPSRDSRIASRPAGPGLRTADRTGPGALRAAAARVNAVRR